jgi:flagellar hook-length control protein FliK
LVDALDRADKIKPSQPTIPLVPHTVPASGQAMAGLVQLAAQMAISDKEGSDIKQAPGEALTGFDLVNARSDVATAQTATLRGVPDVALARSIAVQIAQVASAGADRAVEITLNPVELGKVRLTLSSQETGMNFHVFADRAETVDLMRRNAAILEAEFQELGFLDVTFSFSQGDDSSLDDQSNTEREWNIEIETNEKADSRPSAGSGDRMALGDGLDLRL